MSFTYGEDHVCEGHDRTTLWVTASVAGGALAGVPLGFWFGLSVVRQACDQPDASNLCGLAGYSVFPTYVVLGAVVGALVAAVAVVVIIARMNRRLKA
jgi:hypothetical protein